ncbi:hypothetical protein DYB37_001322 [Aphanomyces astaci]|uniref:BTB domain-containing protein n=1 Tax=Aphanomyces astaci TaxID=112090 RepID=A0A3R7A5X0_APHAT|nr:hypothetical protein DYB35_001214 [Aphanomyces astaci]RHZ23251.1 hypothetical protein DYB37_001322 [Aphanomyces astaci]
MNSGVSSQNPSGLHHAAASGNHFAAPLTAADYSLESHSPHNERMTAAASYQTISTTAVPPTASAAPPLQVSAFTPMYASNETMPRTGSGFGSLLVAKPSKPVGASSARSWITVPCQNPSAAPCHRSLHVCAIHKDSMYVFGGYDGSNRVNDFFEYNFKRKVWSQVMALGTPPTPRDRHVAAVHKDRFYVFAGFDGSSRVNDFIEFNFVLKTWTLLVVEGPAPIPRDSHVAVTHGCSMYIFGGSTGSAMNDFHELNLESNVWQPIAFNGPAPGQRFCHVGCVYDDSLIVFGGYDGSNRLNDFKEFRFGEEIELDIPPPCLVNDLRDLVNANVMSDITFIAREVVISDVRRSIFLAFLEYLYTDHVNVDVETAMELFVTADRYGVDRLKKICESKMLSSLCIENAASILHAADLHSATILRERCIAFMLNNFDAVTKTNAFEEMGRINVDLVFELLKRR